MYCDSNKDYYSYVYRISSLIDNKHYIGSRYCNMNKRFDENPLLDLKSYQTSSSDTLFKEELNKNPENFKWKIIKVFYTAKEAVNFESKLHYRLDVESHPSFYNRHNQKPYTSKYNNMIIYDLKYKREITVDNVSIFHKEHKNPNMIYSLFKSGGICNNRFCLPHMLEKGIQYYNKINNIHTFYKWTIKGIVELEMTYSEWNNVLDNKLTKLLNGNRHVMGSYKNKEDCIRDHNVVILYKYMNERVTPFNILIKDGNSIISRFYNFINDPSRKSSNGYYKDYYECVRDNTRVTLWYFNIAKKECTTITHTHREWKDVKLCGRGYNTLGTKTKSFNGYYIFKEDCEMAHKIITLYKMEGNYINEYNIFYKEGPTLVGRGFSFIMKGENSHANGFFLDKESCKNHYINKDFYAK